MAKPNVRTDEKKQHFDDIYVAKNPVPFKERILDTLEYVSDNFNRQTFDRLILPWAQQHASADKPLNYVDLAGCFGNTTMATLYGMDYDAIRNNWRDDQACKQVDGQRRFPVNTTGIDISANALAYGKSAGLYDTTIEADLNAMSSEVEQQVMSTVQNADIIISTASLVYLEPEAIDKLLGAFAGGKGEGYMLVNFLNPFALEKADETKRMLLKHLDFVGSMASRHRRLSPLEQENYPGEDWALLEIWVLRRNG